MKPVQFRKQVIDENPPGSQNDCLLIFDVNGDGYNDVVVGGFKGEKNVVWYEYPSWKRRLIGEAELEAGGAVFDINRNGWPDIVAGEMRGNHLYWWERPEDLAQPWRRRVIEDRISRNYHDQMFGDVDGDGEAELVILSKRDNVGIYYDIPDDPTLEPWPDECRHVIYEGMKLEGLDIADVNGDGVTEIVAGPGYFKPPARKGEPWTRVPVAEDWAAPRVKAADLTGTGVLDLVIVEAETYPARAAWFEGPKFEKMHMLSEDVFHGHSLEVGDFNGDGLPDIFIGEMHLGKNESPKLWFFLNAGRGGFEEQILDNPIGTHESKAGDFGNTGRLSVVVKPYQPHNRVELWENVTE